MLGLHERAGISYFHGTFMFSHHVPVNLHQRVQSSTIYHISNGVWPMHANAQPSLEGSCAWNTGGKQCGA